MPKNKKGTNDKSTQGSGGSSKQANKKSGGTVPIEKMRFMPGENQAENCQKLIDHLANKVLGEKGMGSKIAHLLQEEEECQFDKPSLKVPDESKKDDPDCEKQKREMELEFKEALSDLRKKKESHEEGKERLASVLCEKCSSHVITKLEAQDDWKKIRFEDPVEILKRIKDIVFNYKGVWPRTSAFAREGGQTFKWLWHFCAPGSKNPLNRIGTS